jgi:hypothetical protein
MMPDIYLILTVHQEYCNCDEEGLYKIIEEIKPEIIFEELDYEDFNKKYKEPCTVETKTITKYLQNYKTEHIPVDTYVDTEFNEEKKTYIEEFIVENDNDYRKLIVMQKKYMGRDGFKYLNSLQSSEAMRKIITQEEIFFKNTDNEKYKKAYREWIKSRDNRECEILKNIYKYSKMKKYSKGIFFIGAHHTNSITNKIQEYKEEGIKINWILNL